MFTTSETVGLAEWIIDDTCLIQDFSGQARQKDFSWPCIDDDPFGSDILHFSLLQ